MEERVMSRSFLRSGALVLGLGLASAGVAGAPGPDRAQDARGRQSRLPSTARPFSQAVSSREGFADVVAKVTPAVVTIRTERKASPQFTQLPQFPEGSRSAISSASARRVAAGRCRRRCSAVSARA